MKTNAIDMILLGTVTVVLSVIYAVEPKWFHITLALLLLYVGVYGSISIIYWWHRTREPKVKK